MDRNHLVPEQRVDRNGKTSTRWVKQTSAEALATLGIKPTPPPALTYSQNLAAQRINKITDFMGVDVPSGPTSRWILNMNKRELDVLDSALAVCSDMSLDRSVVREKEVIRGIFQSLPHGSTAENRVALEMLTLREAFCSPWSQLEKPSVQNFKLSSYVHGLRDNYDLILDEDSYVSGYTASVRFAYEINERCPNADFRPTKTVTENIGFSTVQSTLKRYITTELANLVWEYSQQTDHLIELAVTNQTNDAATLRGLLENPEGAKAVVDGWL